MVKLYLAAVNDLLSMSDCVVAQVSRRMKYVFIQVTSYSNENCLSLLHGVSNLTIQMFIGTHTNKEVILPRLTL